MPSLDIVVLCERLEELDSEAITMVSQQYVVLARF